MNRGALPSHLGSSAISPGQFTFPWQAASAEEKAHALQEGAQRVLKTVDWLRKHRFMPPGQLKEWQHLVRWQGSDAQVGDASLSGQAGGVGNPKGACAVLAFFKHLMAI